VGRLAHARAHVLAIATRLRSGVRARVVTVTVNDRPLAFAVERQSSDPIQDALVRGQFPSDAVKELWLHFMSAADGPSSTNVIDVGAHLGTFSLPAAAAGASVVAIEASSTNAALLSLAAKANRLHNMKVVEAVAAGGPGTTSFIALGPYGHVASAAESATGEGLARNVRTIALDELVHMLGWSRVDFVKIDVEGSELDVLRGMTALFDPTSSPVIFIEANAHMLAHYGQAPRDVLRELEAHRFDTYLIDPTAPGVLVPMGSDDMQTECVADYVAFRTMPELGSWRIGSPLDREELVERVIRTTETADPDHIHRSYGEGLISAGPSWLKGHDAIRALRDRLEGRPRGDGRQP